jgi:2'-5' RNA ligase
VSVNLFFAALPTPELQPAIAELGLRLARAHGLKGRLIAPERLHVSLASAHAPHLSLQDAIWRAQALATTIRGAPLPLRFDVSGSFRGGDRHPFVLRGEGMSELAAFRALLCRSMRSAGFEVSSSFTPHMTLLWADRCVEDHPVAPIGWHVPAFVLIMSLVGEGTHIRLGRWPLTS